jgi:hypothetical protein
MKTAGYGARAEDVRGGSPLARFVKLAGIPTALTTVRST